MALEEIRADVAQMLESIRTAYASPYPLVLSYSNQDMVDPQVQRDPYLEVDIKLISGEQADLSDNPIHRFYGQIVIGAAVREGTGTKAANELLDYFYPRLQRKAFGCVRTYMATVAPVVPHLGWLFYPVLIPFRTDKTYAV